MTQPTTLFEVDRHPMWTAPTPTTTLPPHVWHLRRAIARSLTPLDGRKDFMMLVNYCEYAYALTVPNREVLPPTHVLIGRITERRLDTVHKINEILAVTGSVAPQVRQRMRRDIATLTRLNEEFVQALDRGVRR